MASHDITNHLIAFAETQIRDLGPHARNYLRRCLAHWRKEYGDDLADDMERRLRAMIKGK